MPDMKDMQCVICERIKTIDEIAKFDGMCEECSEALKETDEAIEAGAREDDLSDPEIRGAIKRFTARKEYMAKYNQRPDIIAKRKGYMKDRARRDKQLIEKAKRLGVFPNES
jgi:hypothetical protein